ncbi:MAG: Ig-like domain-containing protein [Fimbriimonadaceae bacterium]|nr:Ig-like domain-containing protein [Chitinophagales bacterium]
MQKLSVLYVVFIAWLIQSCANQVTPTGGEKDVTPPQPLSFSPKNKSTFFSVDEIEIQFDEYFQTTDIFNQVVISPPLDNQPEIKVKGKKLIIKLNNTLRDSTTYTINFGESIKDITENNVLENFTYVFSTGSYIDSLSISGNVVDILTGVNAEKAYAVLYPAGDDSLFLISKPYYFAKTNESGSFVINNIKEGNYNIYAIEDQNFNFYYDLPNERIAFSDSIIKIDTNASTITLQLFSEDKIRQKLLSAKSYRYGQSKIAFGKNTRDVQITFKGEQNIKSFFEKNITGDTLTFWHRDIYLTEHTFQIQYDTIDTIINVAVKSFPKDSVFTKNKNTFRANAEPTQRGNSTDKLITGWDMKKNIQLTFLNPLDSIFTDQFLITEDSLAQIITPEIKIDSLNKKILTINYNWQSGKKYFIHINRSATIDIFGLSNDSVSYYIQTKKIEDYGTINFDITNSKPFPLLLQFMKKDNTLLQEKIIYANTNTSITYNFLLPDKYIFRAIADRNNNGKWDTGNLSEKKQPEQIYYYPGEVTTKANWEMQLKWDLK